MAATYGYSFVAVERSARTIVWALAVGLLAALPSQGAFAEAVAKPLKVVVLGDSLTAGLGLPGNAAFPAKLQKALKTKGIETDMVNAGVSGDTANGGLERLDWSVPQDADAVIVELGANDALRGTDPKVPRKALGEILQRLKARNIPVLLAGMLAPPNYGKDYAAQFDAIYPDLAKQYGVPLYPFFLDGVAADAKLNQADGIHPTAAGVDVIVGKMLPTVEAFLGSVAGQNG
jgi:acyl-CoA thioesterase-1